MTVKRRTGYLLGVDLGSSSIRAVLYTRRGDAVARASRPTEKSVPDPSRPHEIVWPHDAIWAGVAAAIREVISLAPDGARIDAIAVACLGMDGLPVDEARRPLYPFISWHDERTASQYRRWIECFGAERQFLTTGNHVYPFNTAFRLQWMAENEPEILMRADKWVLIGDFINMKLCGTLATDHSMASCTLMFDPGRQAWSDVVLGAAGIDRRLLCEPLPSGTVLGGVTPEAATMTGLRAGTPVVLGGHDYLCGVLPVGGHEPGTIVNVVGTWDVVQTTVADFAPTADLAGRGLTIESHVAPGGFSIYGGAIGGAVVDWYRGTFGAAHAGDDRSWFAAVSAAAEKDVQALLFIPHLAGATCPVDDPLSAGAFVGLRTNHTRDDMLAALHRGLAFQGAAIVRTLEASGVAARRHVVVGGGARNDAFNQLKADLLGHDIEASQVEETTALGAAMLAGLGVGSYAGLVEAYEQVARPGRRFVAREDRRDALARQYEIYEAAVTALAGVNHKLTRSA